MPFCIRCSPESAFGDWLRAEFAARQANDDGLFAAQQAAARLRRSAAPELEPLLRRVELARAALTADERWSEHQWIARELECADRAIAGLSTTKKKGREQSIAEKLQEFVAKRERLRGRLASVATEIAAPRAELQDAESALVSLRVRVGLASAEDKVAQMAREQGGKRAAAGDRFEQQSERVVLEKIVPFVSRPLGALPPGAAIRVLRSVTLGVARGELDFVVVLATPTELVLKGTPPPAPKRSFSTLVLAVVESKRNINDCAHGFSVRQENMAFLTGDVAGYDTAVYQTGFHHKGKFQKDFVHETKKERFVFNKESFRLFTRDPVSSWYLDRLFFITRDRPLLGMRISEFGILLNRIISDPAEADLDSPTYVHDLYVFAASLASPLQAHDVVDLLEAQSARDGGPHLIRFND